MPTVKDLYPIYLKIAPADIAYLKSILESYEELGVIRTLNRQQGEIVILAPLDSKIDLMALLEALRPELEFRIIPEPEGMSEDWLLSDAE